MSERSRAQWARHISYMYCEQVVYAPKRRPRCTHTHRARHMATRNCGCAYKYMYICICCYVRVPIYIHLYAGNMYNFIGAPVGNSETPLWEFCYEDLRGSVTQSGLVPRILRALSAKSRETKKRMVWQMSILELKESRLIDLLQNRREVKILGGQPREIVWEPFETESQMRALWEHGCRERTVRFTPDQYYPQNSNVR